MKQISFLLLGIALLTGKGVTAQTTSAAPYCAAGYDDAGTGTPMHYISSVALGSLNNVTGTTFAPAPHYTYFNNIAAPAIAKGASHTITIGHDPMPTTIHWVVVYIDYNHNNTFDTGERVFQQSMLDNSVTSISVGTFTVPASALTGTTRMRVMVFEDDNYFFSSPTPTTAPPCTADATGSFDFGETEDYDVNITAASTGVEVLQEAHNVLVYPNPANGSISLEDYSRVEAMSIIDLQGRTLQSITKPGGSWDISRITPGIYFLRIIRDGQVSVQRLSVE